MRAACLIVGVAGGVNGQSAGDASGLAKASQNPVGDLTAVPLQFNFNTGGGLRDQTVYNLNFQPVLPLPLGRRWNLIARTIVPYLSVGAAGGERQHGIADIQEQAFFVQTRPAPVTVGVGPVLSFPTATLASSRTGAWALGPAVVVVRTTGAFVLGALVTQRWTAAREADAREVNAFNFQPFVNYNLDDGWALVSSPIVEADFTRAGGDRWTVPVGLGISKVTVLGTRPMSVGLQYYHNVVRPHDAASSLLRFTASFLFPKPSPAP